LITIAIVEDDSYLRQGLSNLIQSAEGFRCVCLAASAEEALDALRASPANVLLLDIGLPGMAGSDAVTLFRAAFPEMAILMLTVYSDRSKVFTSICNGACGYLLKSTPPDRLLEAISAAHAGGSPLSPEIANNIVQVFQTLGPPTEPSASLSAQEKSLLLLLAQGYSYETAGRWMNISVNTVRNYIRSIYYKLRVHSKSEAVVKALRQGLIG